MANQCPFLKPRLPFTGYIQGGLFEGKVVTVTGRVLPGAERFHVNLLCGFGSSDVALHFNPRYSGNSGVVVCNTMQSSSWGREQRVNKTPLPRGSSFTLNFLVNRDSYSVIVNGTHFLDYLHRISVSSVNVISVDGGVEIESISFQNPATPCVSQASMFPKSGRRGRNRASIPKPCTVQLQQHVGPSQAPPPYSPPQPYVMPYKSIIQGGLYPGKMVSVQGFVNHNADRFAINLRFHSGLALHFNPRLNDNVVVRNSQLMEKWGAEERAGGMPFYRGQAFLVTIICDTQFYKIMINGVQMFTYNHRYFQLRDIDILEVVGNALQRASVVLCTESPLFSSTVSFPTISLHESVTHKPAFLPSDSSSRHSSD